MNLPKDKINKRIVVLGGGTGMPVLLRGLKALPIHLSTIVTVADDGGSTGLIRQAIETPAPGDIRNVIAALANVDDDLEKLFQYRFKGNNGLSGHSLGNMVLVAMSSITGDFHTAINKVANIFQVKGNIYPVVNESITLNAEMSDGSLIAGESNIVKAKGKKIKRVFLTPEKVSPLPNVIREIQRADMIVISPGSLYTSILPNIIIPEIKNALIESNAETVYVCNVMTQLGETNDYMASDHIKAMFDHVGEPFIDTIIIHDSLIREDVLQKYRKEKAYPVTYDLEKLSNLGLRIIADHIIDDTKQMIRHDTEKIAEILYERLLSK